MSPPQKPSLPSIKEMFPEYLMQVPPHLRTPPPMMSPGFLQPFSGNQGRPRSHSATTSSMAHGRPSHKRPSMNQGQRPPHVPRGPSTSPTTSSSSARGFHAHPSSLRSQSGKDKPEQPDSFVLLRSVPRSTSLQHISSSSTYSTLNGNFHGPHPQAGVSNGSAPIFQVTIAPSDPHPRAPIGDSRHSRSPEQASRRLEARGPRATSGPSNSSSIIAFPVNGSANGSLSQREFSPDDPSNASDDGDLSGSTSGKKHVCSTCLKRFNRPSSLRIHVNTHTGATPFRCPYPNCGREFNVNSNMRRHYRNHNTPGFSRSQSNDNRRRRRRAPPHVIPRGGGDSTSPTIHIMAEQQRFIASPPISSLSMSDDSDSDMSDPLDGTYAHEDEDELESPREPFPPDHRRSFGHLPGPRGMLGHSEHEHMARQHYSQPHLRPFHHSPTGPPSSPSPSPPLPEPVYSPSAPYVRSLADSRVSTALRPAFHSPPLPRKPPVKEEPMSDIW